MLDSKTKKKDLEKVPLLHPLVNYVCNANIPKKRLSFDSVKFTNLGITITFTRVNIRRKRFVWILPDVKLLTIIRAYNVRLKIF